MGKTKQSKEKKFDRNVEISAPILDPEIIKLIHTPPKGQRLDIKHGGFKALLSDLNSQDSTDDLMPLNENHVPSYIGISCAVSGYSNYSSYTKQQTPQAQAHLSLDAAAAGSHHPTNRSQANSPLPAGRADPQIHHITIDKSSIVSPDEERRELTAKLTASATERRRSPSPCIPPTEDDRHHGAYVGARYFPMPPPDKVVTNHIPLLGIDDDLNPDEIVPEDTNKVEQKIASLYGEKTVEDWRESMTHKSKKELSAAEQPLGERKSLKDLVNLKPTPVVEHKEDCNQDQVDVPTPSAKVLANVEKQFLNKLLTDENPPTPKPPSTPQSPNLSPKKQQQPSISPPESPARAPNTQRRSQPASPSFSRSPTPQDEHVAAPMSPDSSKSQSVEKDEPNVQSASQVRQGEDEEDNENERREEHIEYEIRAQSPLDNQSSPVRAKPEQDTSLDYEHQDHKRVDDESAGQEMEPESHLELAKIELNSDLPALALNEEKSKALTDSDPPGAEMSLAESQQLSSIDRDGHYYLRLLGEEANLLTGQVERAEVILEGQESELNEEAIGMIRSAVGKANLLLTKKFNQFKELCEANISGSQGEDQFATLNDDLAGFWDMLSIQISDVRKLFEELWRVQDNNWIVEEASKGSSQDSDDSPSSSLRDCKVAGGGGSRPKLSAQKDQARRERLQEHITQMKQSQAAKQTHEDGC